MRRERAGQHQNTRATENAWRSLDPSVSAESFLISILQPYLSVKDSVKSSNVFINLLYFYLNIYNYRIRFIVIL